LYTWPEYNFSVAVEPMDGPQADAWPLRERAYFEFAYQYATDREPPRCTFSMAVAGPPFERDYPGRSKELLDTVIPLILPMTAESFPATSPSYEGHVPEKMRSILGSTGAYYRHRDEPDTQAYRQAHPTTLDVACWSKNPVVRSTARTLRALRDRGLRD
jgi:hypothetical protein